MSVQVLMRFVLLMVLCSAVYAEVRMNVEQLRAFITSSTRLGHSDKQIADYVKTIRMIERLDASTVEDIGAGPRTTEALKRLSDTSKELPVAKPPAPKPIVQPPPPPSAEEQEKALNAAREYALDYSKKLPNLDLRPDHAPLTKTQADWNSGSRRTRSSRSSVFLNRGKR